MLAGTASMTSAKTLKDYMSSSGVYPLNVNVNAWVKNSTDADFSSSSVTTEVSSASEASLDYKAKLDMSGVRAAYATYVGIAEEKIANADEADKTALEAELKNAAISGEFTIKITHSAGMNIPDDMKTAKVLKGFSGVSEIFEETDRTYDSNTAVIKIKVKDGLTKESLENKEGGVDAMLADMELSCAGVTVDDFGTYTISGEMTGETKIGDFATVKYTAVKEDGTSLAATATVKEKSTSSGGSRVPSASVTKPEPSNDVKVTIESDDAVLSEHTIGKGESFNPYELDVPEKENHIFGGWVNKATGEAVNPAAVYNTDVVIEATWIETGVKIEFNVNGEAAKINTRRENSVNVSKDDITVDDNGTTIRLADITVELPSNMVFAGWFTDADCTNAADETMIVNEDTVLYTKTQKRSVHDIMNKKMAYVAGYPDGTVKPEKNITREEVATIFFRLLKEEVRAEILATENDFADVDAARWSNDAISTMKKYGLINGYSDGTFRPTAAITRAEFVTMVARFYDIDEAAETSYTDAVGHWAEKYIALAQKMGWINGYSDGTFRPDKYITRAEAIKVINNLLDRGFSEEYLKTHNKQWVDNPEEAWYYYDVVEATTEHESIPDADEAVEDDGTAEEITDEAADEATDEITEEITEE